MSIEKRIVIKIGSSSLTSRHGEISKIKLEKLATEIAHLKDAGHEVVLVSSGAVAAGYRKLGCLKRPDSLPEKQAAASIGQGLLIESYSHLFLSHGYVASQILILRSDFLDQTRYQNVRNTLNVLLERGIIPIVNENDTLSTERLNFGDNDTLAAKVAGLVDADQLVILSDIDGLYDKNPTTHGDAKLIERVTEITDEIESAAGGSGSSVGTGGMKSKIEAVKIAMASGISTFLGNANAENIIVDAVGEKAVGTYFNCKKSVTALNQKKKWIAFHSGSKGEIILNPDAVDRMVKKRESLRLKEIYQIDGRFEKGSVVRVMDTDEEEIARGVVKVSSVDLQRLLKADKDQSIDSTVIMEMGDFVCHIDAPISVGV
ncbi:glutamate 5-kinase [Bacillus sp. REN16]|uniref:glutamate 5-kinase n=1 Tax=Bacillus sp. REN16 TaxID=2887296 RepID=UPI001E44E536|nr:glutamate 5-kinase [Bacillus sp. REN16]MCC3358117.1 glutamate 5-kinase [Bacillus sp. REN16]